jgi:hypothetical protein
MPSFSGIKGDCDKTMVALKERLDARLRDPATAPEDLPAYVGLLLDLKEPPEELCHAFLATAEVRLQETLDTLRQQVKLLELDGVAPLDRPSDAFAAPMDILEFVDHGCNHFVSDLCLVLASYTDTFLKRTADPKGNDDQRRRQESEEPPQPQVDPKMASAKLLAFANGINATFFDLIKARMRLEKRAEEAALRVRALDRFHRRIQAVGRLLPEAELARAGLDLVLEAADSQCKLSLAELKTGFQELLVELRQSLATAGTSRRLSPDGDGAAEENLTKLANGLIVAVGDRVRSQLQALQLFIDGELTFAVKTYFRSRFCRFFVREGVVVAFFGYMIDKAQNFYSDSERVTLPSVLLVLSRYF